MDKTRELAKSIAKSEGITVAAVYKRWEDNRKKEEERQRRLIVKTYWEEIPPISKDDILSGVSYRITTDPLDGYSYKSDILYISAMKNGAISFHDENVENFTYFYPDQLKYLAMALKKAKEAKRKTNV